VLAALLVAGVAWRTLWQHGGDRPLAWRDATAGLQRPFLSRPTAMLFDTRSELEAWLRVAEPGREPAIPPIDFSRADAVLLSTGPRSSTGYAIEIAGVREERGRIVVRARERTPSLAEPVTARLESPVALLVVPERDKPLSVEWIGR
jgi:PrcB C-terminal